jgi:hypothetical protein
MAVTVSISTRIPPQVRDQLAAEARERGLPLATYTRTVLESAAVGAGPAVLEPPDGPVQNEVRCVFEGLPMEAGVHREVCLSLARTVENGGAAGVTAGKELLEVTEWARRRYEYEDEDEDYADD